jgi:hypothetical protein
MFVYVLSFLHLQSPPVRSVGQEFTRYFFFYEIAHHTFEEAHNILLPIWFIEQNYLEHHELGMPT